MGRKARSLRFLIISLAFLYFTTSVLTSAASPIAAFRSARILVSIPITEAQFFSVFGRMPSAAESLHISRSLISFKRVQNVMELNSATDYYNSLPNVKNMPKSPVGATDYNNVIPNVKNMLERRRRDMKQAQKELWEKEFKKNWSIDILVGHNKDGQFYFNDGTNVHISDLAKRSGESNSILFVISCDSDHYIQGNAFGISDSISYRCAASIAENAQHYFSLAFADAEILPLEKVRREMEQYLNSGNKLFRAPHCRVALKVALVSSGAVGYYFLIESMEYSEMDLLDKVFRPRK